ncbi:unnamed protein product, partial [marine sediment metagenome]
NTDQDNANNMDIGEAKMAKKKGKKKKFNIGGR